MMVDLARENLLECKNIITCIQGDMIHDNLEFNIKKGEIVSLIGKSGTGKTSLANVILGFTSIQHGEILWKNSPLNLGIIRHKIGFQPQNSALLSDKTVLENIAMPLRYILELEWKLALELAFNKMLLVGLSSKDANKYPHMLSGGMMKRVALARAMSIDPELLILDEPLSGLDFENARKFEELIWSLVNVSILCITHNFVKSDRYCMLQDKKIVQLNKSELDRSNYVKF